MGGSGVANTAHNVLFWLWTLAVQRFPEWTWHTAGEDFYRDALMLKARQFTEQGKRGIILSCSELGMFDLWLISEPRRSAVATIILDDLLQQAPIVLKGELYTQWSPKLWKGSDGMLWPVPDNVDIQEFE